MRKLLILFVCLLFISGCTFLVTENEIEQGVEDQKEMEKNLEQYDKAIFAGGCFWCSEADFEKVNGVVEVISGYTGGDLENPSYEEVSTGKTGHREAVEVYYDSSIVSYEKLLEVFWKHINPIDEEGQFVDRGYQYTSAIYYTNSTQKQLAETSKQKISQYFNESIATEILPVTAFYKAEKYHQNYYKKNSLQYKFYRYKSGRDQFIDENWKGVDLNISKNNIENKSQEFNGVPISDLSETQYFVTQKNGTEEPFNNEYWDNEKEGIYVDIISGEPLFSSKDKFKSGTGWPSFTKPLSEDAIKRVTDRGFFTTRVEVRGKVSDAHLGHVFNDGPQPTGLRYCMNSAALKFIPKEELKEKGYDEYLEEFK